MKKITFLTFFSLLILSTSYLCIPESQNSPVYSDKFEIYKVDLKNQSLDFFWQDGKGNTFKSFENLKMWLQGKNKKLKFAMNGGMYHIGNIPVGLYIEKGKELVPINTNKGEGNFYLKPNGIFYITNDKKAGVAETGAFIKKNILYATQSGPMLVINNQIHSSFNKNSTNFNIRNGVGVTASNEIYFVISKTEVNFYEMAELFKDQLKCQNALYLDGAVSRMYLPERKLNDLGGDFGVIIGVVE